MTNAQTQGTERFEDLIAIMARLRGPEGCPWDKKQSIATIKDYFLEEVYEAQEAIAAEDWPHMAEELGDVLFEVVFLARLAEEAGYFTIDDCLRSINEKLVRRHPHVFGEERVASAEEVPGRWMALKAAEAKRRASRESILDGIPNSLPTLLQALRVSERAVAVGFEWEKVEDIFLKLEEEIGELRAAIRQGEGRERLEDELGDILFTVVNLGRKLAISPHDSLLRTLRKFRRRFAFVERRVAERGMALADAGLELMEAFWQEAKREERRA